ncbi:hypothetical protein C8R46DRAFT_997229 [Mycena filopes]|nr:hypothetical protein C8R46DRAFT_997229 [Mycena filopes]
MSIPTTDPHLQICPDFASTNFDSIRLAIIGTGSLVPDTLRAAWQTTTDAQKVLWDHQVQQDRDAADAVRQVEEAAAEQLRLAAEKEKEAEKKEMLKKAPKLADFDENKGVGDHIRTRPSPFAVKKLDEFLYIELYYFTPEGCADAADQQRSVAEDGFALAHTDDALALRPISSFRASRNVIKDSDLTWRQMEMGANGLLEQMTRSGWTDKHTRSVATFFYNLSRHPFREIKHGEAILLIYQASARRDWHDALRKGEGYNIALFNDNLLRSISDKYWQTLRGDEITNVRTSLFSADPSSNSHLLSLITPFAVFDLPLILRRITSSPAACSSIIYASFPSRARSFIHFIIPAPSIITPALSALHYHHYRCCIIIIIIIIIALHPSYMLILRRPHVSSSSQYHLSSYLPNLVSASSPSPLVILQPRASSSNLVLVPLVVRLALVLVCFSSLPSLWYCSCRLGMVRNLFVD